MSNESAVLSLTRRDVLLNMGLGLSALTISTALGNLTPAEARAMGTTFAHFTPEQGRTLEVLGEALLPGAGLAGIAHYIDDQLGRERPLLILKYLDYEGSYGDFYRQGLAALDRLSTAQTGKMFLASSPDEKTQLLTSISAKQPRGWGKGPPAPLFYYAIRSDAVDVFYGTQSGFKRLNIPYLAHIAPLKDW